MDFKIDINSDRMILKIGRLLFVSFNTIRTCDLDGQCQTLWGDSQLLLIPEA